LITIRRALLSAYEKQGLDRLAAALIGCGAEILSSGGTQRWLAERGFPVVPLEEWAQLPSMFGGRVKTLHPKVHGGILFRRDDPQDQAERESFGIEPIDLVAVHLYPFEEQVRKDPSARDAAVEMIDVGGPTMLRAAAKNHRWVAVICDPADYVRVAEQLEANQGRLEEDLLRELAAKVFRVTARYDAMIASYLQAAPATELPDAFVCGEPLLWRLRYGENPSQRGAFYSSAHGFPGGLTRLQGKEISFNNLQDLEGAAMLVRDLGSDPAAVVIKHATPCGAATGSTIVDAYRRARDGDALSAFGGIVGLNRPVDRETALEIASTFLELVVAPAFDAPAREVLAAKKNLILLEGPNLLESGSSPLASPYLYRALGEGILVQDPVPDALGESGWEVVTQRAPTLAEERALSFAWKIVRAVRSNGIVLAREGQTVGIGGGQTSRIDALWVAIHKAQRAGHDLAGSVMASDAFFPFSDCVEVAAKAGVTAIIQPGGSKRDADSVAAADAAGIAMVVNHARCFRHG
jgi:phosphoribosylaminoimidazolecarboxamide formyltransferase/IMP cyclohydrolase